MNLKLMLVELLCYSFLLAIFSLSAVARPFITFTAKITDENTSSFSSVTGQVNGITKITFSAANGILHLAVMGKKILLTPLPLHKQLIKTLVIDFRKQSLITKSTPPLAS